MEKTIIAKGPSPAASGDAYCAFQVFGRSIAEKSCVRMSEEQHMLARRLPNAGEIEENSGLEKGKQD